MTIHSHSSLNAFKTCPKRYYLTRVARIVKEPETGATVWGNQVHKAFELRLRNKTPFPALLMGYETLAETVEAYPGTLLVEQKLCVTKDFQPCAWNASDGWVRGIIDVCAVDTRIARSLDWKTGKVKSDPSQLKMSSALIFAHYPAVMKVFTGYVWLKDKSLTKDAYAREQLPEIWGSFTPEIARLEQAYQDQVWPAKPGGLCKDWCPVGKGNCTFCGKD